MNEISETPAADGRYLALENILAFVLASLNTSGALDIGKAHERLSGHIVSGMSSSRAMRPDKADYLGELEAAASAALDRIFAVAKNIS